MPKSTKPLFKRIAVVFDFDDTLAPDTITDFVKTCGVAPDLFWEERVQPKIEDGWDPIPAALTTLIEVSKESPGGEPITRKRLQAFGQSIQFFKGVPELFSQLRKHVEQFDPSIEVEFYLITCGIAEIARASRIAPHFQTIWGCEFDYGPEGEIRYLKQIVSHTEKTRYVHQISKGIDQLKEPGQPFAFNRSVPEEKLHLPLSQLIYVGDGFTDIPCFSLLHDGGGPTIGVYKESTPKKWGEKSGIRGGERVENLAPAEYGTEAELTKSLILSLELICRRIALLELGKGE